MAEHVNGEMNAIESAMQKVLGVKDGIIVDIEAASNAIKMQSAKLKKKQGFQSI